MARKKQTTKKYYDIQDLLNLGSKDPDIRYFMAFGERSAGKSYSCGVYALKNYWNNKKTTGLVRRYDDDWGLNVANTYFDSIVANGEVTKITGGKFDNIVYWSHKWYLSYFDTEKGKMIKDEKPFAYAYALNTWEKSKASQQPAMNTVIMEEFITNTRYLGSENSEFNYFLNLISTLARDKDDFKCILVGNTIRRYGNPYFICMGIEKKVLQMQAGDIVVFKSEGKKLKIAVEYTDPPVDGKKSDILFDFPTDNEVSRQITKGEWQIDTRYPTLPQGTRILPKEIVFSFFMIYRTELLQGDIVFQKDTVYLFFHRKTTEIKDLDNDIIFDLEYHIEGNYYRDITRPVDILSEKIWLLFKSERVFVQDPEVGEVLFSYIESLG